MPSLSAKLRADAERIWRAGVAAVLPEGLIPEYVRVDGDWLAIGDDVLDLRPIGRIAIVGAGKAAGAMAVALEKVLGPQLFEEKQVSGWVNVPADCVVPTQRVHLHSARAPGVNEPSAEGVEGTRRILDIVSSLGDPLDLIASGPTVQCKSTTADALGVLEDLGLTGESSISAIVNYLRRRVGEQTKSHADRLEKMPTVTNLILGNNATAVDGAGVEAERLGYSHAMIAATKSEGAAEDVGRRLASMALSMRGNPGPDCLISGGEPTVMLVDERRRGKGGRNQELALAALAELGDCEGICLLSGG